LKTASGDAVSNDREATNVSLSVDFGVEVDVGRGDGVSSVGERTGVISETSSSAEVRCSDEGMVVELD